MQIAGEAMYDRLLEHGVEIWNFQPSMLHAKVMTVDGVVANIGSANLNARSTACDEEINSSRSTATSSSCSTRHFDEDLERSVAIEPGRWASGPSPSAPSEKVVTPIRRLL